MAVLQPTEYDASYFDGASQPTRHNAGYSKYERWKRNEGANSLGEYWLDRAKQFFDVNILVGKKVLEIGCAKGFIVQDLRDMGVDAYGLDVSSYAIGEADPVVAPFLTIGDMRTALAAYSRNEFDVLFSLRTLECIDDVDLPDLITEMNRISRFQFHEIDEFTGKTTGAGAFYNQHTLSEWQAMGFGKKTRLMSRDTGAMVTV